MFEPGNMASLLSMVRMSHIPLEPFLALNNLEPSSAFATPPPEPIARPTALEATARCTNHCFHDYGSERSLP